MHIMVNCVFLSTQYFVLVTVRIDYPTLSGRCVVEVCRLDDVVLTDGKTSGNEQQQTCFITYIIFDWPKSLFGADLCTCIANPS